MVQIRTENRWFEFNFQFLNFIRFRFSDSGSFDVDLILDVFENMDVNIILAIPLNSDVDNSWYQRRFDNYSVKSAYSFVQKSKTILLHKQIQEFEENFETSEVHLKVKNFLWHASSNYLPTEDLLRLKRVRLMIYAIFVMTLREQFYIF